MSLSYIFTVGSLLHHLKIYVYIRLLLQVPPTRTDAVKAALKGKRLLLVGSVEEALKLL